MPKEAKKTATNCNLAKQSTLRARRHIFCISSPDKGEGKSKGCCMTQTDHAKWDGQDDFKPSTLSWIKEVLPKLCHIDLRDFMSQCGKHKRFSYSSGNLAVIAYKRCDSSLKSLHLSPRNVIAPEKHSFLWHDWKMFTLRQARKSLGWHTRNMMPNGDRMMMDKMHGVIVIWHHSRKCLWFSKRHYKGVEQKHNTVLVI